MMHDWWWGGGGFGWFSFFFMLLFWALIIAGIVLVVRAVWGGQDRGRDEFGYRRDEYGREEGGRRPGGRSSALDVLEERYARGEIEREEFLERKKDLQE